MPYMYILKCADESFYTGSTWNLQKRFEQHNCGEGSRYTSKRIPVKLMYYEYFDSINAAYLREKQIQKWSHAKKEALIRNNFNEMDTLSECRNETHYRNAGK